MRARLRLQCAAALALAFASVPSVAGAAESSDVPITASASPAATTSTDGTTHGSPAVTTPTDGSADGSPAVATSTGRSGDGVIDTTDAPLGNFMRPASPQGKAVGLTEVLVASDRDVSYAFTRLTAEARVFGRSDGHQNALSLRARAPLVLQRTLDDPRLYAGVGNLQLEAWYSWRSSPDPDAEGRMPAAGRRLYHGLVVGAFLPLGLMLDAETHAYFQAIDESVPAFGVYTGYNLYVQGRRVDVLLEATAGLGFQQQLSSFAWFTGTQATLAGYYKLSSTWALTAGAMTTVYSAVATGGVRYLPGAQLELGLGLNLPLMYAFRPAEVDAPDLALELRYRF